LLVAPVILLAPNLAGLQTLVPYDVLASDPVYRAHLQARGVADADNALVADLVYQNDVWKRFAADTLRDGQVPLWNPYLLGGLPFLAAGQHSLLYPSMLLFLALPVEHAFTLGALIAFWLAGLNAYVLGRTLRLGRAASLVMGASWSSSAIMVTNVVFPMIQGVLVWAPIVLAGIEAVTRSGGERGARGWLPRGRTVPWLLLLAAATALSALSGHVELLYYAAILSAAHAAFRLAQLASSVGRHAAARATLWLAGAAAAGVMLAGVQMVPMAELARVNWRSGSESYETVAGYAFGLRQAVTFVVPDAYGNPAHHAVWDIERRRRVATVGDAMWGTAWGTKNYVEAAAYLGLLPLVLAFVGLAAGGRRRLALFLTGFGALSLSFAFGLPTYRLLFAGLPGFDQLHTPFRWVFPAALCAVVLAGLGADRVARGDGPRWAGALGGLLVTAGAGAGAVLWVALQRPRAWTAAVEAVLGRADGALEAALSRFDAASAMASYQFWNLAHLALFTALSGVALIALHRASGSPRARRLAGLLAVATVAADLTLVGARFNPAVDPGLAEARPPALAWLADAGEAKWGRVVGFGPTKVLWPNTAMRAPVGDVRAYDSLLPAWAVETFNAIDTGATDLSPDGPRHDMLAYNRVGNLSRLESLSHPALAAMGGRYVVTGAPIDAAEELQLDLVFSGDVLVYENARARPRAWVVGTAEVIRDRRQLLSALAGFDPAVTVLLEESPDTAVWASLPRGRSVFRPTTRVRDDIASPNRLEIEVVGAPSDGFLVVSDTWFPGWRASVQPAGAPAAVEVPIYRANGSMRAVPVPPGLSTVRMTYSPLSVKVGLYVSFLAAIVLLMTAAYALWDRYVHVDQADQARRVAVNSAGPMAASLLNKVVDFVFAMLMLRVLGSENAGHYYYAIAVIGFGEIFTNFGLNLLTTREVAREPGRAGQYLVGTSLVRLALWLVMVPALVGYLAIERASGAPVGRETAMALSLLAISLLPGNLNTALSSVFQGLERMAIPAGVSIVATLVKVSLGALALLAGAGFVGLAAVSIVTNLVTLAVLAALAWQLGVRPATPSSDLDLVVMTRQSLPLMLNHLLVTVFFRIDVLLLRRLQGAVVVGWYSAAYKWVDALLIIPPAVTMALFPLLSRHAANDIAALRRTYVLALRWLITLALPVALATTFAAELLVGVLGGRDFLPHGAVALQIMIWFLPFSFANGLTQYVLIALNRQRWITWSFLLAATFNIVANLLVIPRWSYSGAAAVTIVSEIVLMVPFLWGLRDVGAPPILVIAWRPAMATSLMAIAMAALDSLGAPLGVSLPAGGAVFALGLWRLGGITADDRALLARLRSGRALGAPDAVDASSAG